MPIEVINLISDDESVPITPPLKRRRTQPVSTNLVSTDDEVVIVSQTKRGTNDLSTALPTTKTVDDDIECVGEQRGVQVLADYPHFRFQCAKLTWPNAGKPRYCARCFCYVCDIPAAECRSWSSHQNAHDATPTWRAKRMERMEIRKRSECITDVSQVYTPFSNKFNGSSGLCGRHPVHVGLVRQRRKMKQKRLTATRKRRGRPR